jgi:hypothetical protein
MPSAVRLLGSSGFRLLCCPVLRAPLPVWTPLRPRRLQQQLHCCVVLWLWLAEVSGRP